MKKKLEAALKRKRELEEESSSLEEPSSQTEIITDAKRPNPNPEKVSPTPQQDSIRELFSSEEKVVDRTEDYASLGSSVNAGSQSDRSHPSDHFSGSQPAASNQSSQSSESRTSLQTSTTLLDGYHSRPNRQAEG